MNIRSRLIILLWLSPFYYISASSADYRNDIGYTALQSELGASLPNGAGVRLSHVEAAADNPPTIYLPDPNNAQFLGKTITDKSGLSSGVYSGHATGVGAIFYGNSYSMTPGINLIDAYLADNWLGADYLRGMGDTRKPLISSSRVANHSWIGSTDNAATDADILRRVDWVVARDEFIQVVGVNNGVGANSPLLSSAYNVIAVGRSDGQHTTGSPSLDSTYTAGRVRPDIVAPMPTTSEATPVVASAAALLVNVGHNNPNLSTDLNTQSTTNRNGDVIYNAERSEVVKAALMAGADRQTNNTSSANIVDYRLDPANQTANGLDKRFGAGQINIFNSYHMLAAGEQNSAEDGGAAAGLINARGFDYDPHFGGAGGSNNTAQYKFSTPLGLSKLTAALVWNIKIAEGAGPAFSGAATLFDLDLLLYDISGGIPLLLADSSSSTENTENIWTSLAPNRNYLLEVVPGKSQVAFDGDYALAWNLTSVPIPAALPLLFSGLGGLFLVARRRNKTR
ncbi:MAG: VPLPA-CTERM sorting domain-containing protein [Gammaproteobacteria bacterium]|nr:VPLPA-CTERM sorting domain-containing protein [Gammaproteobacteria bacterium]